jgi:metal-responsive CopG/Arc/MetJ family transcriptional regulator
MRTTVTIPDELLLEARELSKITKNSRLITEALRAFIAREAAQQLAAVRGIAPGLEDIPRRRSS